MTVIDSFILRIICIYNLFQLPELRNENSYLRQENYKRCSRASDTSSAYSGSDMMQSSIDDQEHDDLELSGLPEGLVDSDDEESYQESTEVGIISVVSL